MSKKKRINRTEAEWSALVDEFNDSELTQLVFCAQRGVNVASFRRHYQRSLQFKGKRRITTPSPFSELTPLQPSVPTGVVLRLGEKVCIECPPEMSLEAIARLARELTHHA